jgi:cell division protein FtsZ
MSILTVAVVTRPFSFEGRKRDDIASDGIKELSQFVDSLITIPNEKLLSVLGRDISLLDAFGAANDVLLGAVQGIAELITRPGHINVDFADVRTVMSEMGMAMMGSGSAKGQDRARVAAESAISSPLLEDINLSGAKGILVNITSDHSLTMGEFEEVGNTVKEFSSDNATVVVGTAIDQNMSDEIRVTVVATGIGGDSRVKGDPVSLISKPAEPGVDYKTLDRPTVIRNKTERDDTTEVVVADANYLDIPAFLRRQAD